MGGSQLLYAMDPIYSRLRKAIDRLPIPYPETDSGVELRLLKHLFSPREAWAGSLLSCLPEAVPVIHARLCEDFRRIGNGENRPSWMVLPSTEELQEMLESLFIKGAIVKETVKYKKKEVPGYSLMPLAVGMFEMQVDRLTADYARDFESYMDDGFRDAMYPRAMKGQMRTIPVGKSMNAENMVGRYDDAIGWISQAEGPFAVMNCVCRQGKDLLGKSCDHSDIRETCLMLNNAAVNMMDKGNAREITREETISLLERAEKKGFVIQPKNNREPDFICCCCGDCCEILTNAKKLPEPAQFFSSNYRAAYDEEACVGCGICVKRCQMDAFSMRGEGKGKKAVLNLTRCIGCGLCVTTCRPGALVLETKSKTAAPPKNSGLMYQNLYIQRFGLIKGAGALMKKLLGLKI